MKALRWICDHALYLVVAASLLLAGASLLYAHQQKEARRSAELHADSVEAALDTTRLVYTGWLEDLQDTASIWQRRAVQSEGELDDAVAEILELESRAAAEIEVAVPTRTVQGLPSPEPVKTEGEVRVAELLYREEPFTVEATARVPPPPDAASWDVSVAMDALHLGLSVACGEAPDGRKVRPATVNVVGPPWAEIELTEVQTSAGVCSPRSRSGWVFGWDPPWWVEVGGGGVLGWLARGALP